MKHNKSRLLVSFCLYQLTTFDHYTILLKYYVGIKQIKKLLFFVSSCYDVVLSFLWKRRFVVYFYTAYERQTMKPYAECGRFEILKMLGL